MLETGVLPSVAAALVWSWSALLIVNLHLQPASVTDSIALDQTFAVVDDAEHADLHKLMHVDTLQHDFADAFAFPSGLPPERGVEHVIPLLPNSQPPFHRLYRLATSRCKRCSGRN